MNDDECPGCGSTPADRRSMADRTMKEFDEVVSTALMACRFCGTLKCCMCDMGDDVSCITCEGSEP